MTSHPITRIVIPGLAVLGFAFAVYYTLVLAKPPHPAPVQAQTPAPSPFSHAIAGSGLTEANTRNIEIGSERSGIVAAVPVEEGQWVEKGAILFELDTRAIRAEIASAEAEVQAAKARLAGSRTQLADRKDQWQRVSRLTTGLAVSEDTRARRRFAVEAAGAQIDTAQAEVAASEARLNAARTELALHSIRAPVAGRVLKSHLAVGEYVSTMGGGRSLMVIGSDRPIHVRVQIDENDLWRFRAGGAATGALRGNQSVRFPLRLVRVEPLVVPKQTLTGESAERVDTRVLEVVYEAGQASVPLYVGQQVDVYIDAAQQAR